MDQLNFFLCDQLVNNGLNGLGLHFQGVHGLTISRGLNNCGFTCAQNGCQKT